MKMKNKFGAEGKSEEKNTRGKAIAKRIVKVLLLTFAIVLVLIGGSVGVYALTGGFQEKVIRIRKLYFGDDENNNVQVIETLDDVTTKISFSPSNATNKVVQLDILDNYGILDNPPTSITVGEEFTLKLKKDANGNNIGGFAEIKTRDDRDAELITTATIRIYVDVAIPDGSLYFEGSNSSKVTLAGKQFTMPVSTSQQYIYLRSTLKNAFDLQLNNENVKNAQISYNYYRKNGELYDTKTYRSEDLGLNYVVNPSTLKREYSYFQIPIFADTPGTIEVEAKMHRTHEIEQEFEEAGFERLPRLLNASASTEEAFVLKRSYNEFINKYIKYFDQTEESYEFFKNRTDASSGIVTLDNATQIEKSFEYVFVTTKATINVSAIRLKDFTASANTDNVVSYDVFSDKLYTTTGSSNSTNIINEFGLKITTDNENSGNAEQEEKAYMFESLNVTPYLYLESSLVAEDSITDDIITWEGRQYRYLKVYENETTPILEPSVLSPDPIGYLLILTSGDEYFSVTDVAGQSKSWRMNFNVPLPKIQSNDKHKALYLGFDITGLSIEDETKLVTKYAFTRVYINYKDYDFVDETVSNLEFENNFEGTAGKMTINTNLNNTTDKLASGDPTRQDLSLKTEDSYISNYNQVSYKSVMYFAEASSNIAYSQAKKIATVGKYKFVNFTNSNSENPDSELTYYSKADGSELIGERIFTYTTTTSGGQTNRQYYIQTLNASTEPVNIFAVVYLSDSKGNPIDLNGRKLKIDEANVNDGDIPELVVIRITDCTKMPAITIDSYLEEVNFYTQSLISYDVTYDEGQTVNFGAGFINRNDIGTFTAEDGTFITDKTGTDQEGNEVKYTGFSDIQKFLKLKLLKDNYFTLYMTGFELDNSGSVVQQDSTMTAYTFYDVFNEKQLTIEYEIDTMSNKRQAFNNICKDFENYNLFVGGNDNVISIVERKILTDTTTEWIQDGDGDASMVRYVLHATDVNNNPSTANSLIYLDPAQSTIPYSNTLGVTQNPNQQTGRYNYTSYQINRMVVTDVKVNTNLGANPIKNSNKLYATYANIGNGDDRTANAGKLTFSEKNGTASTEYKFSVNESDDIYYDVFTNLKGDDDQVNLDYVDCSQAGERTDIDDDSTDATEKYYKNIDEYIAYYLNDLNTAITYTNANSVISFNQDYSFTNMALDNTYGGDLYFGSHAFSINQDPVNPTVNINGYELPLTVSEENGQQKYELKIAKGTYFPVVDSGKTALIYNEEFEIQNENGGYIILDYVGGHNTGIRIPVALTATLLTTDSGTKAFNPDTYIDDTTTTPANGSAITVSDDTATVNFIQGEEIGAEVVKDENGKFIEDTQKDTYKLATSSDADRTKQRYSIKTQFVEDQNGTYYKDSDGNYKLIDQSGVADVGTTRYSKKGVMVYLLISYKIGKHSDGSVYDFTFYRMIQYEILQEEIDIIGVNGNNVETGREINSITKPLKINAGTTSTIRFGGSAQASESYITYSATGESYFFQHVTFTLKDGEVRGTLVPPTENNNSLQITYPQLTSTTSATIEMTYKYKGQNKTANFYLEIQGNVKFEPKSGQDIEKQVAIEGSSDGELVYQITSTTGTELSVSNIISTYFDVDETSHYTYKFTCDDRYKSMLQGNKTEYTSNDGNIQLNESYIEKNKDKDYVVFSMCLVTGDGTEIKVPRRLQILIAPKYTIDLDALNIGSGITIYNGTDLFGEYIKLYNGTETSGNAITDNETYKGLFTISVKDNNNDEQVQITDGKISLKNGTPKEDTTITLVLKYTKFGTEVTHEFTVTIRGVEMRYSTTGDFSESVTEGELSEGSDLREASLSDKTITIEVESGTTISDLNKYFLFAYKTGEDTYEQLQAVLVDEDGKIVDLSKLGDFESSDKTYHLGYAQGTGGNGFELIEKLDYQVKIHVKEAPAG